MADIQRYIMRWSWEEEVESSEGEWVKHSDHEAAIKAAVMKEREACAKACENNSWAEDFEWWKLATKKDISVRDSFECAKAIRARGAAHD